MHFWTIFVGVNLTFLPQHFLGLAGQPRRIPDYPSAFHGWNGVSTLGSTLSVAATLVFVSVVALLLSAGRMSLLTDPWHTLSVASHIQHGSRIHNIQAETLEHSLESPTPSHGFKSLPLTPSMGPTGGCLSPHRGIFLCSGRMRSSLISFPRSLAVIGSRFLTNTPLCAPDLPKFPVDIKAHNPNWGRVHEQVALAIFKLHEIFRVRPSSGKRKWLPTEPLLVEAPRPHNSYSVHWYTAY